MFDLTAVGEMLIDFTPYGDSNAGNPVFERNPGGGVANLVCAAAKMGAKVSFISKVGDEAFGQALKEVLVKHGIDTRNFILDPDSMTSLAFVTLAANGERSFLFFHEKGADTLLREDEIDVSVLGQSRFFAASTVMMTGELSRKTNLKLMKLAKEAGAQVFFDPNIRFNLWEREEDMKVCIESALEFAHIVKLSDEELVYWMGEGEQEVLAKEFVKRYGLELALITLGKDGCLVVRKDEAFVVPGFPLEVTVDTTGAGDSFSGSLLSRLARFEQQPADLSREDLYAAVRFANAVGSLTTTKKGGICGLPTIEQAERLLATGMHEQ
ncbi:MAG: carbohydrate kinase [Eubacteriales bacterium]|nr:carbohydrate kinase [Eubacteriales bacterium]